MILPSRHQIIWGRHSDDSFLSIWRRDDTRFAWGDFLVAGYHITGNIETSHLSLAIRSYSDGLLKTAGELTLAVVCHIDFSTLTRSHRLFGIGGNGASATGNSLIDNQWRIAYILKCEGAFLCTVMLSPFFICFLTPSHSTSREP